MDFAAARVYVQCGRAGLLTPARCAALRPIGGRGGGVAALCSWHSAQLVRRAFVDFFGACGHEHVRSSSVLPRDDRSLPFVNAGMNQFKSIILGEKAAPFSRAVSYQKCVRISGRHDDLSVVGTDGHHHTFFEMLGNWSFGDYFKSEACALAWRLLTREFGLSPRHLYVTYFSGDQTLGIPADLETVDIWRQLGVSGDRILPFSAADNLWEMGESGPCGPCTEIHYDRWQRDAGVADRVNRGHDDVVELWNIVFMQYSREQERVLSRLPIHHVDTGMGLERLLSILQANNASNTGGPHNMTACTDNYTSSLFSPLFNTISQLSGAPPYSSEFGTSDAAQTNTAQRILADHCRMATVALADGILPSKNARLRRILRRCFQLCNERFHCDNLTADLSLKVCEVLSPAYPELEARANYIQEMLAAEREAWRLSCHEAVEAVRRHGASLPELARVRRVCDIGSAALVGGLKMLRRKVPSDGTRLPAQLAVQLFNEYGLTEQVLTEVAYERRLQFDCGEMRRLLNAHAAATRQRGDDRHQLIADADRCLAPLTLPSTDDADKYSLPTSPTEGALLAVLDARQAVCLLANGAGLGVNDRCVLVLSRSGFYAEAGGQSGDKGLLSSENFDVAIDDTLMSSNRHVLHVGRVTRGRLQAPLSAAEHVRVTCHVDVQHRRDCALHHTCCHLVVAALRRLMTSSLQMTSRVRCDHFRLDFGGAEMFDDELVDQCEILVQRWIDADLTVTMTESPAGGTQQHAFTERLLRSPLTDWLPGAPYPPLGRPLRVVSVGADDDDDGEGLVSQQPCCGTHATSTGQLRRVRVMSVKAARSRLKTIVVVAGQRALQADEDGRRAEAAAASLSDNADRCGGERLEEARRLAHVAPHAQKMRLQRAIELTVGVGHAANKMQLVDQVERQLRTAEARPGACYVVHVAERSIKQGMRVARLFKPCRLPTALVFRTQRGVCVRCWTMESCSGDGDSVAVVTAAQWLAGVAEAVDERLDKCPVHWNDSTRGGGLDVICGNPAQQQTIVAQVADQLRRRARQLFGNNDLDGA